MTYVQIRKIEIEQKAVALTFSDGTGNCATLSTDASRRIRALILDDLGIEWEFGAYGPEALQTRSPLAPSQVKEIARECREYAEKFGCTLADAMADYEFDDGHETDGLSPHEKTIVSAELRGQGVHVDQPIGEEWTGREIPGTSHAAGYSE